MFSYTRVTDRPTLFLAMTGLTQAEFESLLPYFQQAWDAYRQQTYQQRPDRQRQYGGGQLATTLGPIEDKLLFILYYLKAYPLQEILAFEFDMVQSAANEWIHILSPVLQEALDRGATSPNGIRPRSPRAWRLTATILTGLTAPNAAVNVPVILRPNRSVTAARKKRIPSKTSSLVA